MSVDAATTVIPYIPALIFGGLTIAAAGIAGWVYTTRLRIKNGYPLDGAWGQSIYPKTDQEAAERVKLLNQENAQLRSELASLKNRLANVEKIIVDDTHKLSNEIESLRVQPVN